LGGPFPETRSLAARMVVLQFSVSNIQKYIPSVKFASLFHWRTIAKSVTWTLDLNRPCITGSNDIDQLRRKAQGVFYNVTKIAVSFHRLLGDFRQKPHWQSSPSPRCRDKG